MSGITSQSSEDQNVEVLWLGAHRTTTEQPSNSSKSRKSGEDPMETEACRRSGYARQENLVPGTDNYKPLVTETCRITAADTRGRDVACPQSKDTTDDHASQDTHYAKVYLLQSLKLLPGQSAFARVKVEASDSTQDFLLESNPAVQEVGGPHMSDGLVQLSDDKTAQILVQNPLGLAHTLQPGTRLGDAFPVTVETPEPEDVECMHTWRISTELQEPSLRKLKLETLLEEPDLPPTEKMALLELDFVAEHQHAFCLEEGERGETDMIQMEIDTGDARPRRQPARRMPPLVQREVSQQLAEMQKNGVIEPSSSPWASPNVLVKKRDGTHRFCVDYRGLNAVTTPDSFPLPRIDDLLERLGESKYFSTIDLASGFWQIRVHPSSQPKTAFVV